MDEFEYEFQGVEALVDDPEVSGIVSKAAFLNEYLVEFPMNEEEARRALQELNDTWQAAGLKNETMNVNGDMWMQLAPLDVVYDQTLTEESHTQFTHQPVVVAGFTFLITSHLDEQGIHTTQAVYLNGRTLIDSDEGVEGKIQADTLIALNERTRVSYDVINARRATAWMDVYRPEDKVEIDEACVDTSTDAEAVLALRDFSINTEGLDKSQRKELKKYAEVYLESSLDLEKHVPYLFETSGQLKVLGVAEDGTKYYVPHDALTQGQAFISVSGVILEQNDDKTVLTPALTGSIIAANKRDLIICRIPFTSLDTFESVREILRARYKNTQNK